MQGLGLIFMITNFIFKFHTVVKQYIVVSYINNPVLYSGVWVQTFPRNIKLHFQCCRETVHFLHTAGTHLSDTLHHNMDNNMRLAYTP